MRQLALLLLLAAPLRAQTSVTIGGKGPAISGGPSVVQGVPGSGIQTGGGGAYNGLKQPSAGATFGRKSFAGSLERIEAAVSNVRVLRTLGGVEGAATLVEIDGVHWVRKWWPASRASVLNRVQNELFFNQLIREFEGDTFEVAEQVSAVPDGSGGWYYYSLFREGARKDSGRYETGLTQRQRVKLAALRFVWSLGDLHGSNVLFTDSEKPFLIDFEMVGDNGVGMSNEVFDRSALKATGRAAVDNLIYYKQQPYFLKQTKEPARIGPYSEEMLRWRERLSDPEVVGKVLSMMRHAQFSEAEIEAYFMTIRSNLGNFERNFKPYLDEVNEIVKRRQKLRGNLQRLRRYFPGLGDAVAAAGDSYLARSRSS